MTAPPDPTQSPLEPEDLDRPASAAPTERAMQQDADGRHDPYEAFRFPAFRTYVGAWALEVVGSQVQTVAVAYELYQRTRSPLALGWVGLVQAVPLILLALPAGHLADRFERRRIVAWTQWAQAVCSVGLLVVSLTRGSELMMYAMLGVGAVAQALGGPARAALLPALVPTAVFSNATTWKSSVFQIASVLGPAAGGLILIAGPAWAYAVAAVAAGVFAAAVGRLRVPHVARKQEPPTLATLLAGVRFVYSTKIILATLTLDLFAVLLGGAVYLLPVFAEELLNVGPVGFGWLRAAPAIGAFAMAMVIAHRPPMRRAGAALLWAVAGFGAATIVFGLSRNFWLSLAALAATGALDQVSVVIRHTLVQVLTPDAMRGRVSAVNNVFIGASNEIGGLESGVTAWLWGPVVSVVAGGTGTILVVAAVAWAWPQVRRFGSLRDARPIESTSFNAQAPMTNQ